jgi:hypothetical protein
MTDYIPVNEESVYYKSNKLIMAKGKISTNENNIIELAICKIQKVSMDKDASLITTMYANELKSYIKNKSNVYATLKNVSQTIGKKTMMIENGKGDFAVFPIIQKAEYKNGVFTIRFNEEIRPYITQLTAEYTKLKIAVSKDSSSIATSKLYGIFEKELYPGSKSYDKNLGCSVVEYAISDLKFMFGLIDIDHPSIAALKEKMRKEKHYDWDLLYDALPEKEKIYKQSKDFIRRMIEPARKELYELSNIKFEYEPIATKGKKITRIRFFIYKNEKNEKRIKEALNTVSKIVDKEEDIKVMQTDINELYEEFIGLHLLTKANIDDFLEKADYDVTRVRNAIYYTNEKGDINDFVGYVISVIMHPEWDLAGGAAIVNGTEINKELTEAGKAIIREQTKKDTQSKNSKQIWETVIKSRDDFNDFLTYMESKDNWDLDTFELVFTDEEKVDYWKKWALNK